MLYDMVTYSLFLTFNSCKLGLGCLGPPWRLFATKSPIRILEIDRQTHNLPLSIEEYKKRHLLEQHLRLVWLYLTFKCLLNIKNSAVGRKKPVYLQNGDETWTCDDQTCS